MVLSWKTLNIPPTFVILLFILDIFALFVAKVHKNIIFLTKNP